MTCASPSSSVELSETLSNEALHARIAELEALNLQLHYAVFDKTGFAFNNDHTEIFIDGFGMIPVGHIANYDEKLVSAAFKEFFDGKEIDMETGLVIFPKDRAPASVPVFDNKWIEPNWRLCRELIPNGGTMNEALKVFGNKVLLTFGDKKETSHH